jgi:N-acetyl-alpha-D-glucosaminyl L-malate synthase BshA
MTQKNSTLRIGITCFSTFGGSGVIATEIGMAMAKRGHKVHFICSDVPRRLDRFLENIYFHEVEVRDYPVFNSPPYVLSLSSKMVEVATYENLDLLHVHYAVPHAASAYLACQVLGNKAPKLITTLHGTDITLVGNDRSYLPITRFAIEKSDGVTAPSKYLKHATYDKLNVSSDKDIKVIPNFVDTDYFTLPSPEDKAKGHLHLHRCSKDLPSLIHISNFRQVKRMDDVVEVFEQVYKQYPCHLILIGDGPERSRIEQKVREKGLIDQVCFLGKLESFVQILQQGSVFLLPSENESFGLAALEAMSCGVPVVASQAGGIPEVVVHGESGFLAPIGDINQMAEYTLALLNDKALWKKTSKAARNRAVEHYRSDLLTVKYEEYYRSIVANC